MSQGPQGAGPSIRAALAIAAATWVSAAGADEDRHLLTYTTYTVDPGQFALGLLAFQYGIVDGLVVGTEPLAWALRVFEPIWVPNLHLKWAFLQLPWLRLTADVGIYYAFMTRKGSDGRLVAVPSSLFASTPITDSLEVHLEGAYGYARASGTGHVGDFAINGAVATTYVQLGALGIYRLSDLVRLTLRGRAQVYSDPVVLKGDARLDDFTTAHLEFELNPEETFHWMVAPGVALLWPRVHLWLGVGYGNIFVPGPGYPIPDKGVVPDGTVYVLF